MNPLHTQANRKRLSAKANKEEWLQDEIELRRTCYSYTKRCIRDRTKDGTTFTPAC
jgi:hypothetical protein